jgi:hypothetical protein
LATIHDEHETVVEGRKRIALSILVVLGPVAQVQICVPVSAKADCKRQLLRHLRHLYQRHITPNQIPILSNSLEPDIHLAVPSLLVIVHDVSALWQIDMRIAALKDDESNVFEDVVCGPSIMRENVHEYAIFVLTQLHSKVIAVLQRVLAFHL